MSKLTSSLLTREYFEETCKRAFSLLRSKEHLFVEYNAESSQFIRVNGAKIRQSGVVDDASVTFTFVLEGSGGELRKASHSVTLQGVSYADRDELDRAIRVLQAEVPQLPADPFAELPQRFSDSVTEKSGELLPHESAADELLGRVRNLDLVGVYASGPCVRGMANSAGLSHWFKTEVFSFDYSLYTPEQRNVKSLYAGQKWSRDDYQKSVELARMKLSHMSKPARKLARGSYRTYLEPAAVGEIMQMMNWGFVSESAIRQGESALMKVRSGEKSFSPLFSLMEDFSRGEAPRFNELGELAPEKFTLIENGKLLNTLVSSRTSKEYGVPANGADEGEGLRAPKMAGGALPAADALKKLGTGLYLSNLHYLNWSDQVGGRITGMTRYACFWVEEGEIQGPIENLRFDDSIFHLFGANLEAVSREQEYLSETMTYELRHLGGVTAPGALLSGMEFTL